MTVHADNLHWYQFVTNDCQLYCGSFNYEMEAADTLLQLVVKPHCTSALCCCVHHWSPHGVPVYIAGLFMIVLLRQSSIKLSQFMHKKGMITLKPDALTKAIYDFLPSFYIRNAMKLAHTVDYVYQFSFSFLRGYYYISNSLYIGMYIYVGTTTFFCHNANPWLDEILIKLFKLSCLSYWNRLVIALCCT